MNYAESIYPSLKAAFRSLQSLMNSAGTKPLIPDVNSMKMPLAFTRWIIPSNCVFSLKFETRNGG